VTSVIVQKLNIRGEVSVAYEAELAETLPGGVRLEARWTRPTLPLGYTTFETGDRFVEWYYTNRWYNIFEIHGTDGFLKGWYCNVAEPATFTGNVIACRDLLLDLWVSLDGSMQVLDEDEFAADTELDAVTRAAALRALDELKRMVRASEAPFSRLLTGT
jgi:predicted RNA-binding protein associated with RNAse of E/G family